MKGVTSMPMQNATDLFIHEMGDMYDAEQRILQMLPLMAQECNVPEVKQAFQQHEQETRQQVLNLEQCFQILGVRPQRAACHAIAGLKQEHDAFLKEQPTPDLITMFDLGGAAKTEYYEIASYEGLIEKASEMGQTQCVQLLQQNLQQEQAMAQRVSTMARQIGRQMITPTQPGMYTPGTQPSPPSP
jgi:ferritin-like metal-binding protein YciE